MSGPHCTTSAQDRNRTIAMTGSRSPLFALLATLTLAFGAWTSPAQAHGFGRETTPGSEPQQNKVECTDGECSRSKRCTKDDSSVGDPIWTYNGSLYLRYTDLSVGRNYPIHVTRMYDSQSEYDSAIGYGWAFAFDRRLFEYPDGSIVVRSGCGSRSRFVYTGGAYVAPQDGLKGTLTALGNGTYRLRYAGGNSDEFDTDGRLSASVSATGARHEYVWDSRGRLPLIGTSPRSVDPNVPLLVAYQPRLTRIRERGADGVLTGYHVDFEYSEATGRVTRAVANDGREVNYGFDVLGTGTRGNLVSVTGLDDYAQSFAYVVSSKNPDPHNITSIVDGTGAMPVTNEYDAQDRVVKQFEDTLEWTLSYPSPGVATVAQKVHSGRSGTIGVTRTSTHHYDAGGYLTKIVDALGHETRYIYDGNRDIVRRELWELQGTTLTLLKAVDMTYNGLGQPLTESVTLDSGAVVTTTRTYDSGWVSSIQTVSSASAQVFRTEYTFVRDAQNVPQSIWQIKRRKDDGSFATTTFTYCSAAEAASANTTCPDTQLVKQIDGPRTDVADVVTFTYYGSTDTSGCTSGIGGCHRRGDRKAVSNALGQTLEFLRYDSVGRATKIRDANNVVAEMSYHARGWLLEQVVRGPDDNATTDDRFNAYQYDARGNITRITAPDGRYVEMTYDGRDRLTKTRGQAGDELRYAYDNADNLMTVGAWEVVGSAFKKRQQDFNVDKLDRVVEAIGSTVDQKTTFAYDAAGRQKVVTDPNLVQSLQTYDDLDRLTATVSDTAGIQSTTGMSYDAVGNLRAVVDPKGLTTSYTYDALGRMTQQVSPDSGTTGYTYDDAGNPTSRTDARGITATTTYDALGRPTTVTYPTAAENVSYVYDTPDSVCQSGETFATGRLSRMTDQSGSTAYCYDRYGNVVRKVQTTGTQAQTVRYSYDVAERLQSVIYPDGSVADYARDSQGRVNEVGVTVSGGTRQVLLTNATYMPFGPTKSWTYGNGRTLNKTYDLDYRATGISDAGTGGLDIGYVYDSASYLKQITTQSTAIVRAKFEYDALGRLTTRKNAADVVQEAYGYDATGNRLTQTVGGTSTSYSYPTTSHRLTQVGAEARTYDSNGNLGTVGGTARSYVYNNANRMSAALSNGTLQGTYTYNGFGEQVQRQTTVTTRFVYDEAGQLLGQYDVNGAVLQQYVWLDGQPVGVILSTSQAANANARMKYVQSDMLGSPRAIIDPTRNLAIWRWDESSEGFGSSAPNTDPDADGTQIVFDLRFPGQRYDSASGLNYNYFRDYEPATGRYSQSDPIGLAGGISTYGYSGANPAHNSDPLGLAYEPAGDEVPYWYQRLLVGRGAHDLFSSHILTLGDTYRANSTYDGTFGKLRPDAINTFSKQVWELKPISNMDREDLYRKVAKRQMDSYMELANRFPYPSGAHCTGWRRGSFSSLQLENGQSIGQWRVGFITYDIKIFMDNHGDNTGLVFYRADIVRNEAEEIVNEVARQLSTLPLWTPPPTTPIRRPGDGY